MKAGQDPRQRLYRIAFRMMTHAIARPSFPSYRRWMDRALALGERIAREGRS